MWNISGQEAPPPNMDPCGKDKTKTREVKSCRLRGSDTTYLHLMLI